MLTKILAGPLFGAALASGWWAWALWGDGCLLPTPSATSAGGGLSGLALVIVSGAYCVMCLIAAGEDAGAFKEDGDDDEGEEQ